MLSLVPLRPKAQTWLTVLISCALIVSNQLTCPVEAASIADEGIASGKPDKRVEPSINAIADDELVEGKSQI